MKYTQNYNLRKPEDTDPADIQDLNYNADEIDGKLKEIEDWEAAHLQASNPHSITPALIGAETPQGAQARVDVVAGRVDALEQDYSEHKSDYELNKDTVKLKVAKLEQEVKRYKELYEQSNPTQSPRVTSTGYGVVSLPKNAANGQVNVIVKGLTATNLLAHDKFEGRTSAYTVQDLGDRFRCINDGAADRYNYFNNTGQNISIGDKVYIRAKFLVNTNGNGFWPLDWYPAVGLAASVDKEVFTDYEENTVYEVSVVLTATDNRDKIIFTFQVPEGSTNGHYWDIYKDCIAINLTKTFGAGNEPTKEECDRIFANWFNGTKSTVGAMRLKSVSEDETETSTAYVVAKDEEGNIAELRSLPNGVKDEVSSRGVWTKAVSDTKTITGSNIVSIITTGANVDSVWTARNLYPDRSAWLNNIDGKVKIPGKHEVKASDSTHWDKTESINGFASLEDGMLRFYFAKGEFANLAEAQAYFNANPITLTYQLATPIEIPIQVSGSIVSYPNGTIYIERILPDAGVYTDKITILHQDAPIKRLDKLSKVDFMTGVETELDINQAEISEDKLSFTHPELSEGEIVFFEYEYDVESTEGETEVEFYDSRYVVKDTETGKFYKWYIVIAIGQPSIELVGV